jgi:hypothetical protein
VCEILPNHTILHKRKVFDEKGINKNQGYSKALESKKGKKSSGQCLLTSGFGSIQRE